MTSIRIIEVSVTFPWRDYFGGKLNNVCNVDLQINPEQAREEFRASVSKDGGSGVKDFMDSVGLGGWVGEVIIFFIELIHNVVNAKTQRISFNELYDF